MKSSWYDQKNLSIFLESMEEMTKIRWRVGQNPSKFSPYRAEQRKDNIAAISIVVDDPYCEGNPIKIGYQVARHPSYYFNNHPDISMNLNYSQDKMIQSMVEFFLSLLQKYEYEFQDEFCDQNEIITHIYSKFNRKFNPFMNQTLNTPTVLSITLPDI